MVHDNAARNITPLEDIGTVYPNLKVTDNFGILTVENGALLSSDWSNVIITAPTEITENMVKGNGWSLELNKGWKVEMGNNGFEHYGISIGQTELKKGNT